jgi:transcription elongation factor SPT6
MSTKNPKITKKVAAPKPVRKSTPKKAPAGKKEEVKMIEEEAEDDVSLNDEEDDEYDQEDPEDDKFIANDDEVMLEEKMAKRALKREKLKKKKTYTEDDYGVDQDDLELINENRAANSKHRRLRQIQDEDSSEGAVPLTRGLSSEKPKNRIRALDDEDDG